MSDQNAMRLEINYRKKKKLQKITNMWRLNNVLLNNGPLKKSRRRRKNLEKNKTKTMIQHLWDAAKTILRRNFVVIQTYLRRQEIPQTT